MHVVRAPTLWKSGRSRFSAVWVARVTVASIRARRRPTCFCCFIFVRSWAVRMSNGLEHGCMFWGPSSATFYHTIQRLTNRAALSISASSRCKYIRCTHACVSVCVVLTQTRDYTRFIRFFSYFHSFFFDVWTIRCACVFRFGLCFVRAIFNSNFAIDVTLHPSLVQQRYRTAGIWLSHFGMRVCRIDCAMVMCVCQCRFAYVLGAGYEFGENTQNENI